MKLILLLMISVFNGCSEPKEQTNTAKDDAISKKVEAKDTALVVGAARFEEYLPLLQGKKVGLLVNHTAVVNDVHLVDTLLSRGVNITKIYGPEHGFRGTADDGEKVESTVDKKTGIPIVSLYGSKRKPSKEDLAGVDVIIFDIQDVGVRFYTFISSMSYMMEAAAENNKEMIILDRPNPNGHYVDGPMMQKEFTSFIGLHQVPLVHGMTVGEYARMVNGQYWLKDSLQVKLTVVPIANYDHNTLYELPIKPSPNLPNMKSIYLYPSLGLFEATDMSVGRGTDKQFQVLGAPNFRDGDFYFTPEPKEGAKEPKHKGKKLRGYDLSTLDIEELKNLKHVDVEWLIKSYENYPEKNKFFLSHLHKLAGTKELEQQIKAGLSEAEIRVTWQEGIDNYKKMRKQYLLYPDFE